MIEKIEAALAQYDNPDLDIRNQPEVSVLIKRFGI